MSPPVASAAPTPLRCWLGFAAFYATSFAALGVYMQFFPSWLRHEGGLSKESVSFVLSAQTIARTLLGTFWARQVDRTGDARRVLIGLAAASVVAFALFGASTAVAWAFFAAFAFGSLYSPMYPIVDAAAMQAAHGGGFAFGRLRMVGSLSFLVVNLIVGAGLDARQSDGAAVGHAEGPGTHALIFPVLCVLLVSVAASAFVLPRSGDGRPTAGAAAEPWWALLRQRPLVLLLLASALIQGSHATYYNLSTLHWSEHGLSHTTAGALWAEGIVAEIVLFFVARRTVDRLRPTTLLMVGAAAAVVRWSVVGLTTAPGWLFATAWLHALTFACTYLGSLRALETRVPVHQRATAQGLLGAASSGVGMVVCGPIGGFVYERWEGLAFLTMAAFAFCGFGLAFRLRRNAATASAQPPPNATSKPA